MIANTQRRIVHRWYFMGLFFLVLMFLPSVIGLDGMNGGFALSFVAGFMVICSVVVIVMYRSRARQLDKILAGEGRLALWRYAPEEWMRFVAKDFESEKKLKGMLFKLIAGVSVVIGILLTANSRDFLFIPIILGIIVLVAIPAIWAPRYRFNKLRHSDAEVLISENGVIIGRMFHLWKSPATRLDTVTLDPDAREPQLTFIYSALTRTGWQEEVARVPVPYGMLDEAIRIKEHFASKQEQPGASA